MSDENQWYTNKDLFERLTVLRDEFNKFRSEMLETRILISKYNGLREEIQIITVEHADLKYKVQTMINESTTKKTTFDDIRAWGGWLFGLITLIILIYNQMN